MNFIRSSISSFTTAVNTAASNSFLNRLSKKQSNHNLMGNDNDDGEDDGLDRDMLFKDVMDIVNKMSNNENILLSKDEIDIMCCYFANLANADNDVSQRTNIIDSIRIRLGTSPGKVNNPFVDFLTSHYAKTFSPTSPTHVTTPKGHNSGGGPFDGVSDVIRTSASAEDDFISIEVCVYTLTCCVFMRSITCIYTLCIVYIYVSHIH